MGGLSGERLLFVSNHICLQPSNGGVQWCTREYLETLEATGLEVLVHPYRTDARLLSRLSRKLRPRPFHRKISPEVVDQVCHLAQERQTRWIALNNTEACAIAEALRRRLPDCRLLFLSHGAEITDALNTLRLDPASLPQHHRTPRWLGQSLLAEMAQRRAIDGTVCISAEDVVFEHWLGSQQVVFLPRQVTPLPLPRRAKPGRVGTVSTLDHAPNISGIAALARALQATDVQLRLVGGPERIGRSLQARFPWIHYCGRLSDPDLQEEAATWRAFANPIFSQARGASTKVATALGWGLPVLSTAQGVRGYLWDAEALPLSDTPDQLAARCAQLAFADDVDSWSARAHQVAAQAPNLAAVADRIRDFLSRLERSSKDSHALPDPG